MGVDVFLSYARVDRECAAEVRDWLREAGHRVFLDSDPSDGVILGEEWKERLYQELRRAQAFVCLLSHAFGASTWCTVELGVADSLGLPLLPLRVETCPPHPVLGGRQYADYRADPAEAKGRLTAALGRLAPTEPVR